MTLFELYIDAHSVTFPASFLEANVHACVTLIEMACLFDFLEYQNNKSHAFLENTRIKTEVKRYI